MADNEYFFLMAVTTTSFFIRTVYEILRLKKIISPHKKLSAFILFDMLLLWSSWFALCEMNVNRMQFPLAIKCSGIIMFAAGVIIVIAALFTIRFMGSKKHELVISGIYSKIRHPIYLGFILWLMGYPVFTGQIIVLCLSPLFIANVLVWRYAEEVDLIKKFPAYKEYKAKTIF